MELGKALTAKIAQYTGFDQDWEIDLTRSFVEQWLWISRDTGQLLRIEERAILSPIENEAWKRFQERIDAILKVMGDLPPDTRPAEDTDLDRLRRTAFLLFDHGEVLRSELPPVPDDDKK